MSSLKRSATKEPITKKRADVDDVRQAVLDDVFDDLYKNKRRVYRMNFVRGVFFGMGSIVGGTLIVTVIVGMATMFDEYPFISQILESIKNSIPNQ